jgi:hypothetical protein
VNPIVRLFPFTQPVTHFVRGVVPKPAPTIITRTEIVPVSAPVMLPGQLDRVTGTDEHSTVDFHRTAATEHESEHAPVLRWTFKHALVGRNGFVSSTANEHYGSGLRRAALSAPLRRVDELRHCQDYVTWRYFGHWLMDAIPKALIDPGVGELWMPHHPDWGHAADFVKALGLQPVEDELIFANRLYVYQDFAQGQHKSARYAWMRAKLHAAFDSRPGNDRVYLRRGATGAARLVVNEDALVDRLSTLGWKICDVGTLPVADLHKALHGANVVVSMEGSHINHAHLALEPGSALVMLTPADRFTTNQIGRCRANGITPGIVVANGTARTGYHVDPDEVLRTVDLALATMAH